MAQFARLVAGAFGEFGRGVGCDGSGSWDEWLPWVVVFRLQRREARRGAQFRTADRDVERGKDRCGCADGALADVDRRSESSGAGRGGAKRGRARVAAREELVLGRLQRRRAGPARRPPSASVSLVILANAAHLLTSVLLRSSPSNLAAFPCGTISSPRILAALPLTPPARDDSSIERPAELPLRPSLRDEAAAGERRIEADGGVRGAGAVIVPSKPYCDCGELGGEGWVGARPRWRRLNLLPLLTRRFNPLLPFEGDALILAVFSSSESSPFNPPAGKRPALAAETGDKYTLALDSPLLALPCTLCARLPPCTASSLFTSRPAPGLTGGESSNGSTATSPSSQGIFPPLLAASRLFGELCVRRKRGLFDWAGEAGTRSSSASLVAVWRARRIEWPSWRVRGFVAASE